MRMRHIVICGLPHSTVFTYIISYTVQSSKKEILNIKCVFWFYLQQLKNERPTWCHLLFYFTSYVLNMFRTLIYPSSGPCDCVDELPHRSSCSQFVVCWSLELKQAEAQQVCFSLQNEHHQIPVTPKLQHTTNWEQDDWCGNSPTQSQGPDDGYINVRNMLST